MDSNIFDSLMNFNAVDFKSQNKKSEKQGDKECAKKSEKSSVKEKKLKPSERLLKDIENHGFDLTQMEKMLKTRGDQLVVSCAGSGKTTALIFKIIYDLKTGYATRQLEVNGNTLRVPEKMWVSTFLSSGAEELERSLKYWQSELHCPDASQSIQFSTLHAEFKRALMAMGKNTDIIDAKTNSNLLKEVVKPYQLSNGNGKNLNSEDFRSLESALAYTRNRLDASRYDREIYDDMGIGKTIIDVILKEWRKKRKDLGRCDFEDLQEILYNECYVKNNEDVIKFLSERYNFIYIDEFQDTSQIQYKLLQIYGRNCKQVVAIGDDDQTIYSWRGSDNKIITEDFMKDFNPVKNSLSINFRCPSNILNAIKPSIANNVHRFDKELKSAKEGGQVRYAAMGSYSTMVSTLSDLIYEDVKDGRSVAVLCRVNSDGLMPALILDKLGKFSFSISGDGMTLDSYIGRTVIGIIKLFTEKCTMPVKNALNLLAWDQYGINNLMKVCKANKMSIWTIDEKDLSYSCPSIAEKLLKWRNWRTSMGDIETLKLVLQDYRLTVFDRDTQFNSVVRSVISSVEALLEYFNYEYVEDFLFELEDINERLKGRKKKNHVDVQIATVHEFKGKEADSVYIWNDSDQVFPIRDTIDSEEELEEERRVHYIACTRAKKFSTIIYLRNKPGLFLSEMDFSNAVEIAKSASGVLNEIKTKTKEEANLEAFSKAALEDEDDFSLPGYLENFVPSNDSGEENEFWQAGGELFYDDGKLE